jgi:hypothetical protein
MKIIIITLCVFIAFINSACAGQLYKCRDSKGNPIITSAPQDGMKCDIKDPDEDSLPRKKITSQNNTTEVNLQSDPLSSNMNNARIYLNQAAKRKFSELEEGKEDVRKAIDFLNEAEGMTNNCPCPWLKTEISDVAQYAREAINEDSAIKFSNLLTHAISAFNNSIEAYKRCK